MNILQKAILRACWQAEQDDGHAPRPWLRWLLIRVVGMTAIPDRKLEESQLAKKQWLALRKDAALRIDPERVEVRWEYGQTLDPYGVESLPEEYSQVGRNYFARSPESDMWVSFYDLPQPVVKRLWDRLAADDFERERKRAAREIDPETAEVSWLGLEYFARSPQNHVWVPFDGLPTAVVDRL
jgi:hypothetical protein